ncbi:MULTISPECIES: creatininase family protein [unclassified Nitratireductor]|uniref:creatininase family protein n=1 Tax=unclassified Nitratireductor TaxID=2641084 RepID=UPI0025FAC8CB|nr:creatininase family protein [Nitratireductor sp.]
MTWIEAKEAAERGAVALVPIGSTDANGPQNATGLDFLVSSALAERAAEATGSVYLPPVAYGVSDGLKGFPGTLGITPQMLGETAEAIMKSLIQAGFDHILLITNHGPNQYPVEQASRRVCYDTGVQVASINPMVLFADLRGDLFEPESIGHGAEPGTSLLKYLHPEATRDAFAEAREKANWQGLELISPMEARFGASRVNFYLELEELSPTSGWGDPGNASAERGEILFGRMLDHVVDFIGKFQTMDTRLAPPEPAI